MKVANNMDSVFAGFTEKELEFDVMFDSDDCLIDLVAGVDENGMLLTGEDPETLYEFVLDEDGHPLNGLTDEEFFGEADDPITDKCDTARREGDVKDAGEAPEGSEKNQDKDFETPEGMKSEIPGSGNSEESKAHDVTKDIEDAIKEEDMLTDKDADALRDGSDKYAGDAAEGTEKNQDKEFETPEGMKSEVPGSGNSEESHAHDVTKEIEDAIKENDEVCPECGKPMKECNCAKKEACKEAFEIDMMMEGFDPSSETDAEFKIAKDEGPIEDKDAEDLRDGSAKYDSNNVEGEKQEVLGAANEDFEFSMEATEFINEKADPARRDLAKKAGTAIRNLFTSEGFPKCQVGGLFIGGECKKFLEGEGSRYLYAIKYTKTKTNHSYTYGKDNNGISTSGSEEEDLTADLIKWISKNKGKIEKAIKSATDVKVNSLNVEEGRMGVINLAVDFNITSLKEAMESIAIDLAMEGCDGVDCQVSDKDGMNDVTVPDDIQTDGSSNQIPTDAETQSSDGVEPADESVVYSGWISHVTEADEKVPLTSDDSDIEAVANDDFDSESELKLDVDYDDDELIDLAINGVDLD